MGKGGGDNNQQKAKPGMTATVAIEPDDIDNRGKLAGVGVVLTCALAAIIGIAHVGPHIKRYVFGVKDGEDAGPSLAGANPQQLIDKLKEAAGSKPSTLKFATKELIGQMNGEDKKNIADFIQKNG